MTTSHHPFQALTPDFIMDAVESQSFRCDCRTFALNSYENRVYQVGIDEGLPLIAKFYRPGRWSAEQIMEEHRFCFELAEHELPVVAPWKNDAGESLFLYKGFRFALYPRQGGHAPEFDNLDNLLILGRLLGRLHAIGALHPFAHRPRLDLQSFGTNPTKTMSPFTSEVAVTAVLRTWVPKPTGDHPNVLQHGEYGDPAQLKMQITKDGTGRVNCRFKGTLNKVVVTGPAIDVTDGGWHSVTCWRKGAVVGATVDGVTRTRTRDVGSIQPIRPLTVAARGLAPGDASDQFRGDIDTIVWAIGAGATTQAPAYAAALAVP